MSGATLLLAAALQQPIAASDKTQCDATVVRALDALVGDWNMGSPGSGFHLTSGRSSVRRVGCTLEERITETNYPPPLHRCCFHCPPRPPARPTETIRINRLTVSDSAVEEAYVSFEGREPRSLVGGWGDGALNLRGEQYGWVFVHTFKPQADGTVRVTISETNPAHPELYSALPFEEWVYRRADAAPTRTAPTG